MRNDADGTANNPLLRSATSPFARRWHAEGWRRDHDIPGRVAAAIVRNGACRMDFWSGDEVDCCTVGELHRHSLSAAAGLRGLGVKRGDVVALQLHSSREAAVALLAILAAGGVCLPIPTSFGPAELQAILADSRARVIIGPQILRGSDYGAYLDGLKSRAALDHVVIVCDSPPKGAIGWEALCASSPLVASPCRPDDVCLIVYTSGTTGYPKGVMHSHNSILAEVDQLRLLDSDCYDGAYFEQFPFGHMAGVLGTLRPILHGVDTIYMKEWSAPHAARIISTQGATATSGTPFFLAGLLRAGREGGHDLSRLRSYILGAAPVPPALIAEAAGMGVTCMRAYGLSEQITVTACSRADPLDIRMTTDGKPLPGRHVRIVDEQGDDLPDGEDGEILVIGPELFVGYRDGAQNEGAFDAEGWFRTGDIGRIQGGYLRVMDRKKDIIIRGGENFSSVEIEAAADLHPAVAKAAAVGAPDALYGERVCVFVTLAPPATDLTVIELRAHFESIGLSRRKAPEIIRIIDAFPRTATGKIRKDLLRQMLLEQTAGSLATV